MVQSYLLRFSTNVMFYYRYCFVSLISYASLFVMLTDYVSLVRFASGRFQIPILYGLPLPRALQWFDYTQTLGHLSPSILMSMLPRNLLCVLLFLGLIDDALLENPATHWAIKLAVIISLC